VLTQSATKRIPIVELKVFMLRNGWDQPTLARRLGITKQYLGDILHGKRKALHIRNRMIEELGFPKQLVAWNPPQGIAA
jgi:DNA-binding Xre family transcriptional regulator